MRKEVELGKYDAAQKNYVQSISITTTVLGEYGKWIDAKCRRFLGVLSTPLGSPLVADVPVNETMLSYCLYVDLSARGGLVDLIGNKIGTTDPGEVEQALKALCNFVAYERWNQYAGEVLKR